jgi:HTH-type transcriptional repressor of NAD biosynthesis genes
MTIVKGIVIGKFDMFHIGHKALINFAKKQCDVLYVLVCMNDKREKTPGYIRLQWLLDEYRTDDQIIIKYTDKKLPYTSVSSRAISALWGNHIYELLPDINVIISSEPYGEFMAEWLGIKHVMFDEERKNIKISSTIIRKDPFKYWDYIPEVVRPYFVKKVCLCGTESTGKTILTDILAKHYNTNFVQEWGRKVVDTSETTTNDNILKIGELHAKDILEKIKSSNKILFSDTDINTTKMYSKFLFDNIPTFEDWIEEANKFDLYIFLEKDSPYVQDGTRLSKEKRDELRDYHYNQLTSIGVKIEVVDGENWDDRTKKAIDIIDKYFFS